MRFIKRRKQNEQIVCRNLRFLPVISTCETGITLVESVLDTV
jgi:hypothetical protein